MAAKRYQPPSPSLPLSLGHFGCPVFKDGQEAETQIGRYSPGLETQDACVDSCAPWHSSPMLTVFNLTTPHSRADTWRPVYVSNSQVGTWLC
jgi:hypothetical protein